MPRGMSDVGTKPKQEGRQDVKASRRDKSSGTTARYDICCDI